MAQKFSIRGTNGEVIMTPGVQSNVDAWFRQNPYQAEVRRFESCVPGITVIEVRDVRDVKTMAIDDADKALRAAGLPTYSDLVATVEAMTLADA